MRTNMGAIVSKISAILLFLSLPAWGPAFAEEQLNLTPNRTTKLDISGRIKKIMVSNPAVADAAPSSDGKSVVVRALQPGACEIRIMRIDEEDLVYTLTVRADLSNLANDIKTLLADIEGVTVKVVGDRIVLDGKLVIKSDYDRVMDIANAYQGAVLNLTKLDRTELNRYVAAAIKEDIGLDRVSVQVSGDTATLEGLVFDPADAAMALEKAQQRCSKVVSLLRLEEIMIETDVYFVMIDTGTEKTSGYNILKTLNLAASSETSDAGTSYSASGGLVAKLNALASDNKAKFLAKPHLSTKSGGTGRFHSGGETYFEVPGQVGGSLEKVEHGIILTVKPTLRGQNRVMNEISLEVSVPSAKPQGAISLDKYETSSTAMCKVGESIMLSGLTQSLENQFKKKTPLLGSIPVLSMFFSEKGKSRSVKELVVVITPRPVFPTPSSDKPFSEGKQELLKE